VDRSGYKVVKGQTTIGEYGGHERKKKGQWHADYDWDKVGTQTKRTTGKVTKGMEQTKTTGKKTDEENGGATTGLYETNCFPTNATQGLKRKDWGGQV